MEIHNVKTRIYSPLRFGTIRALVRKNICGFFGNFLHNADDNECFKICRPSTCWQLCGKVKVIIILSIHSRIGKEKLNVNDLRSGNGQRAKFLQEISRSKYPCQVDKTYVNDVIVKTFSETGCRRSGSKQSIYCHCNGFISKTCTRVGKTTGGCWLLGKIRERVVQKKKLLEICG